jgi:D-sedoheptulose 7-phosphate isomerase
MKQQEFIRDYKQRTLETLEAISNDQVAEFIKLLEEARVKDRQVFLCGNGGSAGTASHFANDLGKGASVGRESRFRVLSLTDNLPWITALANDCDYASVFLEQLKNFARPEDLLIAFSGSGNSPNVLRAVSWAKDTGLVTVGITGRPGGKLGTLAEYPIFVESEHMGRIEEGHFLIQHLAAYYFMEQA